MKSLRDIENRIIRRIALIILATPAIVVVGLMGALAEVLCLIEDFEDCWRDE